MSETKIELPAKTPQEALQFLSIVMNKEVTANGEIWGHIHQAINMLTGELKQPAVLQAKIKELSEKLLAAEKQKRSEPEIVEKAAAK